MNMGKIQSIKLELKVVSLVTICNLSTILDFWLLIIDTVAHRPNPQMLHLPQQMLQWDNVNHLGDIQVTNTMDSSPHMSLFAGTTLIQT